MFRKAFTLIELLVVIAIIAILAAILFPVFAQAKAAAKAISAVSNVKEQALSIIMYQGDSDDFFPMGTEWNTGNDELCFQGGPCLSTWAWLTAPYVKSAELNNDPTTAANQNFFNWGLPIADTYMPQFGYNYTYLGYWAPLGAAGATIPVATSSSQADQPSNTVMVASKWVHTDQPGWSTGTLWFSTIPGQSEDSAAESPECGNITQWCFSDWGAGGQWDTGGIFAGTSVTDGRYTAGIAYRVSNGVSVGWVDGHATKTTYQHLAAGTNFNVAAPAGQVGASGNISITSASTYPWLLSHTCALDSPTNCTP